MGATSHGRDRAHLLGRGIGASVWELKTIVAQYPSVAVPLARVRGHGELPEPGTDIAMDAFVRSGLSYAVAAFRLAQEPRASAIAHHAHMPATLIEAARRGIPAMLLVRPPIDAVLSYVIKTPSVSVLAGLRGYVRFHRPLLPYLDKICVATFDQVTGDFGSVIGRINGRFGTSFAPFEASEANVARIRREIEDDWQQRARNQAERERGIPRPSRTRQQMKRSLEESSSELAGSRTGQRATALYDLLSTAADEGRSASRPTPG